MHWPLCNVDFMLQQNDAYEHHYYFACSSVTGELVTQLSTFLISDKINALFLFHVNSYHHIYLQDLDFKRVTFLVLTVARVDEIKRHIFYIN